MMYSWLHTAWFVCIDLDLLDVLMSCCSSVLHCLFFYDVLTSIFFLTSILRGSDGKAVQICACQDDIVLSLHVQYILSWSHAIPIVYCMVYYAPVPPPPGRNAEVSNLCVCKN